MDVRKPNQTFFTPEAKEGIIQTTTITTNNIQQQENKIRST